MALNAYGSSVNGGRVVVAVPSPVAFAVLFQAALHDRGARCKVVTNLVTAISANARRGIIQSKFGWHER